MRIAFVSLMSGAQWGGSELLWKRTAQLALLNGHQVLISIYDWGSLHPDVEELKSLGADVYLRPRVNNQENIFYKILYHFKNRISRLNKTYKSIVKWKPDHILINQGESFDISVHHYQFYQIIQKFNINFSLLCHSHSQYGDIPQSNIYPKAKKIFEEAKSVFFVSQRMQNIIERKLCTRLKNAFITWNPLNLGDKNYITWPENPIIQFAVVGNLGHNKGQDTLFECLSSAKWKKRNWHLNLYGQGYGENYLRDLANFYQISNYITFNGHVSNIQQVWQSNHILLIPSAGEGLPISLIEAMICGRTAVVTDIGGNTEVIKDGVNGFVAEAPSVISFSRALEKAWINFYKWEKMGEACRSFILSQINFKPEKNLLQRILDK